MRETPELEAGAGAGRELAGIAALLGADVAWGLGNVFVKLAHAPAISFALLRLWLGFATYALVCLAVRRRIDRRTLVASLPAGVGFGAYMVLLYTALRATSVADVTLIGALQPALVLLVAGRMFGERVTLRDVLLTAVAMGGVVLVVLGSSATPAWSLHGDLLAALSLLAFTSFWLASKQARSVAKVDTLGFVTAVSLIGAALATPPALAIGHGLSIPRGKDWLWLVLTVLLAGVVAHALAAWAQRHVAVWRSSLIQLAVPVVSVTAAWAWLGERLTVPAALGGAVVLGSLALVVAGSRGTSRRPPMDEPGPDALRGSSRWVPNDGGTHRPSGGGRPQ